MSQASGLTNEIKKRSGWSIFMGILMVILGTALIVFPLATSIVTTVLLAWTLILGGVAEFVFALNSTTAGNFFMRVLTGVVCFVSGVLLAAFPLPGVAVMTGVLGGLLIVQAISVTVLAFQVRPADGWGWFLFDGIVTFLAGVLILMSWPSSSVWAIGTLVGAAVVTRGVTRIGFASGIRRGAKAVGQLAHAS